MGVPISQMWTVAQYVLTQKIKRRKRYPLVLMLEPLFRCNLSCAGCGKIQYPGHILKKQLSVEECLKAVDECGAPIVSIPGGEPLLHPDMPKIIEALVAKKKYVYMCSNAILLAKKLDDYTPSKYLSFSIHMDGLREVHDEAVCREGTFDKAMEGIKLALERGFRVTTNTTVFDGADPEEKRRFCDEMMKVGVEGMMFSPGYSYSKAPYQDIFLQKKQSWQFFRKMLHGAKKSWRFNQSPLFLEFLAGIHDFDCTPWGNPTYNIFGWQLPCYLLQEGYVETFEELMEKTAWENYGQKSGNPKCANCMVHSGYEPTAVDYTFGSWKGFIATVRATLFGLKIPKPDEQTGLSSDLQGKELEFTKNTKEKETVAS
jgi:hopanoid biosynthesis associated radical SAM protein HpnH